MYTVLTESMGCDDAFFLGLENVDTLNISHAQTIGKHRLTPRNINILFMTVHNAVTHC
jgi:hypothetical protein